jgi:hypothetical protein
MAGPCNWTVDVSCCSDFWNTLSVEQKAAAQAFSSKVLWALSGRQFGDCSTTIRPCGQRVGQTYRTYGVWTDGYNDGSYGLQWTPYIDSNGGWRNCGCGSMCSCAPSSQVNLPGPVTSITEVRVGNVIVPPTDYRVDLANGLYWLVGENGRVWPDCQNFDQPATGADAFYVTYTRGPALPIDGAVANGALACEYAKLCAGQACALSAAATSITRDGVSFEILTAEDLISKGFTPMPTVNQWIYAVNPHGLTQRPRVFSFDDDEPRYTVVP